ncbi:MAG: DUF1385 domain-containing protein [Clostridia bacterium]|nr:DUF1385 domain-containing protein [Clostridia bacterium]
MSKKQCEINSRLGKVGGQAVLEGVMMKSGNTVAVSVRREDGTIASDVSTFEGARKKHKILNIPLVRGVVNFIEMLSLSMKTLTRSAELSGIDEGVEESKFEKWLKEKFGKSVLNIVMGIGLFLGILLAIALFFLAPNFLAAQLNKLIPFDPIWQGLFAGIIKILLFILYLYLVSLMKDIRRTFEYHGAEHKSIFCYEKGEELTVENVKKQRRFHPRCGTSFMFVMLFIGMLLSVGVRILVTYGIGFTIENTALHALFYAGINIVILLPLIVGTGYEFLMFAGKHDNVIVRILSAPGLWMQRLTTREPDDKQIEVAIRSLKLAMPDVFPPEEETTESAEPSPDMDAPAKNETSEENAAD